MISKKKAFSLCDVLILQNRNSIDQINNVQISDGTKPGLLDGILKNGLLAPKSKNVFFLKYLNFMHYEFLKNLFNFNLIQITQITRFQVLLVEYCKMIY